MRRTSEKHDRGTFHNGWCRKSGKQVSREDNLTSVAKPGGGNPMQTETQTFKPSHFEDLETSQPEVKPPYPELRNLAGGKPPLQAESRTEKPSLLENLGKGPPPVFYKMDKDDREHGETYCPDSPSQVPLPGKTARGYGAEPLEEAKFLYKLRANKESEPCHFNSHPHVYNF